MQLRFSPEFYHEKVFLFKNPKSLLTFQNCAIITSAEYKNKMRYFLNESLICYHFFAKQKLHSARLFCF